MGEGALSKESRAGKIGGLRTRPAVAVLSQRGLLNRPVCEFTPIE